MKDIIIILLLLLSLSFITACGVTDSGGDDGDDRILTKFTISNPYSGVLTTANIVDLKVNLVCTGSTDAEIADQIVIWQNTYMIASSPVTQNNVSYAMRWNKVMPGIYPLNMMAFEKRVTDNGISKIYGVCWDFAAMYSAIASYYGLTTRISAWKAYGIGPATPVVRDPQPGMSPVEYSELQPLLVSNNLNHTVYDYSNSPLETFTHYRAEVYLTSVWVSKDAMNPTGEWANDANYSEVKWDDYFDPNLATR